MPWRFALWFSIFLLHRAFVVASAGLGQVRPVDAAAALAADTGLALVLSLWVGRGSLIFRSGIYTVLAAFLVFTFGFARVYERPFTLSVIRTDSASIWSENIISGIAEVGLPHVLLILALAAAFVIIEKVRRDNPTQVRTQVFAAAGLMLLVLGYLLAAAPVAIIQNPFVAALIRPGPSVRPPDMKIGADDLVPSLDSPAADSVFRQVNFPRGKAKNVILYFLESTPASAIGRKYDAQEITPNLNRLKARSVYFKRHYANFPLSINAFYNAFCGSYALPDGAWISLALPDFKVQCLSEILKKENYRTIALHAGYLGYAKQKRFMQNRGFDKMIDADTIKKPPYEKGMGPWGAADERSMIRPLVDFVASASEKPFFAVMFAFAPHHPYNMPADFPAFVERDDGKLRRGERNFLNSLHFADHAFGEILAALEKSGLLKDTLVIAVGDHGEAFYEHRGNYNHPFYIYEENIHVPLFILADGVAPQEVSRVTSHVDILPTILDILGLDSYRSPLHVGRSMLKGGGQSLAHVQAFWHEEFSGVVDGRYKFIRKETGERELFDLLEDAGEKQNLAGRLPGLAETYSNLTEKAFAQKKAYYKHHGNYEMVRFKPSSQDK